MSSVIVIGGGIAGLSSAVFLKEKGFDVTLIEGSPKLGGRAYSFYDREKEMFFDNGQHILAGWYENTFEYLKIIGSYDGLNFQKQLEVNFVDTGKKVYGLKCSDDPPPMNLLKGLLKYNALNFRDKFALKNINTLLRGENFEKRYSNVRDLLKGIKQTENLLKFFWEPFILAVFNARPEKVDVKIFLNVLKKGFRHKYGSTLVIPDMNLNELLIVRVFEYFRSKNVNLIIDNGVTEIKFDGKNAAGVRLNDGTEMKADYYISAVSFFAFRRLFSGMDFERNNYKSELLRPSGIVSVHLFSGDKIPSDLIPYNSYGMTGLTGTIVQWIFKRSEYHLSLVISGADELQITDMDNEKIYEICMNDLRNTIEGFDKLKINDYKIIKERRATFIPDYMSNEFRQSQKTHYSNFFVAGDWTDTGLPATIESAVLSGRKCSQMIENLENGKKN